MLHDTTRGGPCQVIIPRQSQGFFYSLLELVKLEAYRNRPIGTGVPYNVRKKVSHEERLPPLEEDRSHFLRPRAVPSTPQLGATHRLGLTHNLALLMARKQPAPPAANWWQSGRQRSLSAGQPTAVIDYQLLGPSRVIFSVRCGYHRYLPCTPAYYALLPSTVRRVDVVMLCTRRHASRPMRRTA